MSLETCRSDAVNDANVGHRFVKPELDMGQPMYYRGDQPSTATMNALFSGTPRYNPVTERKGNDV